MKEKTGRIASYLLSAFCGTFSLLVVAATLFALAEGRSHVDTGLVLELLLQSAIATLFCLVAFTDVFVKRLSGGKRYLLFFAMLLPEVVLLSLAFRWFDFQELRSYLWLIGSIAVPFAAVTAMVLLQDRARQKLYDRKLEEYKKNHSA